MKPNVYSVLLSRLSVKSRQNESSRHARKAWKAKRPKFSFSKIVLFLTLMFLFIPLFVIVAYSFNRSKGGEFTGLSLIWYKKLIFHSNDLWAALLNSLTVAFTAGIVSTILGTLASLGMNWYKFRGRDNKFSANGSARSYHRYFHADFFQWNKDAFGTVHNFCSTYNILSAVCLPHGFCKA